MVVYDFIQLDVPFETVRASLLSTPTGGTDERLPRETWIEVGAAIEEQWAIAVPFHGYTPGPDQLTTVLRGHLEVTRLGPGKTHVSLVGAYQTLGDEPRVGTPGWAAAPLTEMDLRAFLNQVADRLTGAVAPRSDQSTN